MDRVGGSGRAPVVVEATAQRVLEPEAAEGLQGLLPETPSPLGLPRFGHIKVLHIVTRYLRGGSEKRVRDIVLAVPEAQHHLVVGSESDTVLALEQLVPASLTLLPELVREPSPVKDAEALWKLTSLLRRNRFDLVITHQSKAGVIGRTAALMTRNVSVIHSLSMANFGPGYQRLQSILFHFIESRLQRATSAYVVVGDDLARRYARIGVPAGKLHVVRSGVPLVMPEGASTPEDVRERFGIPPGRPLVLYLGSLEPRKNVLDLRLYLELLVRMEVDARPFLLVAGDGPLAGALASCLEQADLGGDARLLGYVPEPLPLVRAADVMVLLSRAEGVPQVLVQAAAAATPFVAYAVDGVQELLEMGARGAAVPLGDIRGAADATSRLLHSTEPSRGPLDLSSWSPETIRAMYRGVIRAALSGPPRATRAAVRTPV